MMINETKLQIPDEYKEKIQVIYKDKDGYWAYLGYGWCWKEKKLHLIYACSEQDFIEEIKQIKACDCDFCECKMFKGKSTTGNLLTNQIRIWMENTDMRLIVCMRLSWKMAKSLMYMKMRLIRITKGITLNNIKPKKGKFYEIIIRKRKKKDLQLIIMENFIFRIEMVV